MEFQPIIDIALTAVIAAIGWFARQVWDATQKLKEDLASLELNVAENYVKKVDINARFDKLESILDKIFDKIDQKADK
jgi:predicted negative regulator of RcsB-dependent stress response